MESHERTERCQEIFSLLSEYLNLELPPDACQEIETHLAGCAVAAAVQLRFDGLPSAPELRRALDAAIPDSLYFDDVHGSPAYRRHLTRYFAEQIWPPAERPYARRSSR